MPATAPTPVSLPKAKPLTWDATRVYTTQSRGF